jgi:hypothetical protein
MNESTLTRLKIVVERAVRPVRASTSRNRKIREELLAHVSAVFEEEAAALGEEQAALERTTLRFGNPGEVTTQLQESVPASDGISQFFDLDGLPGESTLRHALPIARLTGAVGLVIGTVGALVAAGWGSASPSEALILGVSFVVAGPLYTFALGLLTNCVEGFIQPCRRETNAVKYCVAPMGFMACIRGPSGRSWLGVALIADIGIFALMCIAVAIWPPQNWDHLTLVLAAVLAAGYLAADSVVLAWVFANSYAVRRLYNEEWARLPID